MWINRGRRVERGTSGVRWWGGGPGERGMTYVLGGGSGKGAAGKAGRGPRVYSVFIVDDRAKNKRQAQSAQSFASFFFGFAISTVLGVEK